jgi:hypothetical protein
VIDHVLRQHRQAPHLDPFAVQVMLGEADRVEPDFLRQLCDLDHLVDHLLPALGMHRDRPQLAPFIQRCGQCGRKKYMNFIVVHLLSREFSPPPLARLIPRLRGWR